MTIQGTPRLLLVGLLCLAITGCDVFDPHPTTQFDVGADVRDVFAYSDTLLAAADSYLVVYDVSSPRSPSVRVVVPLGRRTNCVVAKAGIVYVGTDSGVAVRPMTGGTQAELHCGGTSQAVTGLATDSTRLYATTSDGITVFNLASPDSTRFIALAGQPTGLARRDSRLFVSLRDWGVRIFNILPGDSYVLDTMRLGHHCRAEGVTVSSGGYCIISQGPSGVLTHYTPAPDSYPFGGGGGGGGRSAYAAAATDGVEQAAFYLADSTTVTFTQIVNRPGTVSFAEEIGADLQGFTRRICLGGNGYVYTASGAAGIYIIKQ